MKKLLTILTMLVFSSAAGFAQNKFQPLNLKANAETAIQSLSEYVSNPVLMTMNEGVVQNVLQAQAEDLRIEIPLSAGETGTMVLKRFDFIAKDAKFEKTTANGRVPFSMKNRFLAYTGQFENEPTSTVTINFSEIGIRAIFYRGGTEYVIASMGDNPDFAKSDYILYATKDIKFENDFICGNEGLEGNYPQLEETINAARAGTLELTDDLLEVEIALESDFVTYNDFGTAEGVASYQLALMNVVSAVYARDVNVKLVIVYIHVWEVQDPYPSTGGSNLWLNAFQSHWNSNFTGVSRDLTHYISTRSNNLGGIAYVDVICHPTSRYAFSNTTPGGSFNTIPTYSWSVMVTAHETGHNFGSRHTHNCIWNPPIDTCWNLENCGTDPPLQPKVGTIMSYCHLTGSINPVFHPLPQQTIRGRAEAAGCVTVAGQALEVVGPDGGEMLDNGIDVTVSWGGSLPDTVTVDVEYSDDNGSSWNPVASGVPFPESYVTWTTPTVAISNNQFLIRVTCPATADQDESDTTFTVVGDLGPFSTLLPANNATIFLADGDVDFAWTSSGTDPLILYKMRFYKSGDEAYVFSGNDGVDTTGTVGAAFIDSMLTAWNAWNGDQATARWRPYAYVGFKEATAGFHNITFDRTIVDISDATPTLPQEFALLQNYPNPFNPSATITYAMPAAGRVVLEVYNTLGKKVRTLVNETQDAGMRSITWNATDEAGVVVASGVYFYRISIVAGGKTFQSTRKMVFIK